MLVTSRPCPGRWDVLDESSNGLSTRVGVVGGCGSPRLVVWRSIVISCMSPGVPERSVA